VCVVVGVIDDEHESLVRRVVDAELVKAGAGAVDCFVDFPDLEDAEPGEAFDLAYFENLVDKLPRGRTSLGKPEGLAEFLKEEPRRWLFASQVELAPGDPRTTRVVAALAGFWSKLGQAMADAPPARQPIAWLQIVPRAPEARPWWRFLRMPSEPKDLLYRALKGVAGARCLRPMKPVRTLHLSAWQQALHTASHNAELAYLRAVDPARLKAELFPDDRATRPMATVRPRLAELIEQC
jgi:hypothetical protein